MSAALVKGSPLLVYPELATQVGLKEAMILQQVHYWTTSKRNNHFYENRYWVHNTYEEWKQQFPFWSHKTIQRGIESLEQKGLIKSFTSHKNKKTKFYTVNYDQLDLLSESYKGYMVARLEASRQSVPPKESMCPAPGQTDLMKDPLNTDQNQSIPENPGSGQSVQEKGALCLQSGQSDPFNQAKMTRSYIPYTETTTETPHPPLTPPSSDNLCLRQEEEQIKKMFKTWDETVYQVRFPGKRLYLTQERKAQMHQILQGLFEGSLQTWEDYCQTIADCPFLMGQNEKAFRVTLDWAIAPKNALKVLENDFYSKPEGPTPTTKELPWDEYAPLLKAELKDWPYAEEWLQICEALVKHLGQITFNVWFRQVRPRHISNSSVILLVPNTFMKDTLLGEYMPALKTCVTGIYPLNTSILIEVDANIVTHSSIKPTKGDPIE